MADFGVVTPLVSIVLSVFMAGLALGSWGGGRLVRRLADRSGGFFIGLYGAAELGIGISGLVVAPLLSAGRSLLASAHGQAAWGSLGYYFASAGWVALVMLPFCTCMGATFPLAMAGIRAAFRTEAARSFSYLYLANVLGAMAGTIGSAFVFTELLGFSKTLLVAAALNGVIALSALVFAGKCAAGVGANGGAGELRVVRSSDADDRLALPLLFATGLTSL